MSSEFQFQKDPEWSDADFTFPTTGYAIVREGKVGQPWAVGDGVQVYKLGEWTEPPKPTWRQRLKHWWYWNRPTVHRGPCDRSDCEEW